MWLVAAEEAATVMALLEPAAGKDEEAESLFMPPLPESLRKDKKLETTPELEGGGVEEESPRASWRWRGRRGCDLQKQRWGGRESHE